MTNLRVLVYLEQVTAAFMGRMKKEDKEEYSSF